MALDHHIRHALLKVPDRQRDMIFRLDALAAILFPLRLRFRRPLFGGCGALHGRDVIPVLRAFHLHLHADPGLAQIIIQRRQSRLQRGDRLIAAHLIDDIFLLQRGKRLREDAQLRLQRNEMLQIVEQIHDAHRAIRCLHTQVHLDLKLLLHARQQPLTHPERQRLFQMELDGQGIGPAVIHRLHGKRTALQGRERFFIHLQLFRKISDTQFHAQPSFQVPTSYHLLTIKYSVFRSFMRPAKKEQDHQDRCSFARPFAFTSAAPARHVPSLPAR